VPLKYTGVTSQVHRCCQRHTPSCHWSTPGDREVVCRHLHLFTPV